MRYFAYGSNLLGARLLARTPHAAFLGTAVLHGFGLRWNKRGADGSAKCNVAPAAGEYVLGAIYDIPVEEETTLDAAEAGYLRHRMTLPEYGAVTLFIADPAFVASGLQPRGDYLALVLAGMLERGFPATYVRASSIQCIPPDRPAI